MSDEGKNLRLRRVNDKVVSKETKDSATVVEFLTKNSGKPELFGEEIEFKRNNSGVAYSRLANPTKML